MSGEALQDIFLKTGAMYFGGGPVRLRTILGSCVSATFWHPQARIGGMFHYLLPSRGASPCAELSGGGLYADEVINWFTRLACEAGTHPADYTVKLFGGGNMFARNQPKRDCMPAHCVPIVRERCGVVSCRNVLAGRELLAANGFDVSAEDVGGNGSRQLIMDLWNGDVWLRYGGGIGAVAEALP